MREHNEVIGFVSIKKKKELVCYRGLFIIDDKRILRQITMNDLPVGRSVDETLRLVQAFQYTDKHGEGALLNIFMLKVVLLRLEGVFVDFFGRKVLSSVRD